MLTQKGFAKEVGEKAVIWIDPAKITHHTSSKWPVTRDRINRANARFPKFIVNLFKPSFRKYEPFVTPAHLFTVTGPLIESRKFQIVQDFIARKDTPKASIWFQELENTLEKTGVARHKDIEMQSIADILKFFSDYVGPLVDDLATNGYVANHTGFESMAVIGADGALIKSASGNHRFSICKAIGTPNFPLRIVGMHADYFAAHARTQSPTANAIIPLLSPIEAMYR